MWTGRLIHLIAIKLIIVQITCCSTYAQNFSSQGLTNQNFLQEIDIRSMQLQAASNSALPNNDSANMIAKQGKTIGKAYLAIAVNTLLPITLSTYFFSHDELKLGSLLAFYGAIIGPAAGNFYADNWKGGTLSILGRGIGGGIAIAGLISGINAAFSCFDDVENVCEKEEAPEAVPLMLIGSFIFVGSTIYNLVSPVYDIKRFNNKLLQNSHVGVIPILDGKGINTMYTYNF